MLHLKKGSGGPPALKLVENPDILATIGARKKDRPSVVAGFAAGDLKIEFERPERCSKLVSHVAGQQDGRAEIGRASCRERV